jgi:type II secretory pathway pseudopilin PulG
MSKKKICIQKNAALGSGSLTGFTLIEMLTVFVILIIVGYSLSLLFKQATQSYTRIRASQEIVDTERSVVTMMTRDLENAYLSKTDSRFRFIGSDSVLNFDSFQDNASNIPAMAEIGYTYDAAQDRIMRREQTAGVPDNDVTAGGVSSQLARNIHSLSFRIGYKNAGNTVQYLSSGATWDSNANSYANYNSAGEPKNPDGLPHVVEVTFTVNDSNGYYPEQSVTTTIYLPQDK